MDFTVLYQVANILPQTGRDKSIQRLRFGQEQRKKILAKIKRPAGRDILQNLGFEYVNPAVNGIGKDLAPGRLLQKTFYFPSLFRITIP